MGAQRRTRPVIIVTGANAGIGFTICHRLLVQLARRDPEDAKPQQYVTRRLDLERSAQGEGAADFQGLVGCEELTLVLACRNTQKAEAARKQLLELLDAEVEILKRVKGYDGHAERFRRNLLVVVRCLDLASLDGTFKFAREISSEFEYISHFICNAGTARFTGMDYPRAAKQILLEDFIGGVTNPVYKLQRVGDVSEDGLGYIWQSNLFGHYVLYRLLEPLLVRYKLESGRPSRILWSSSIESAPFDFDLSDIQLVRSTHPYEVSKFELELLIGHLELQQRLQIDNSSKKEDLPIRHILYDPGIARTNIAVSVLNSILLEWLMQAAFFIAHLLGSRSHVMTPYKASVSAVHLILVALPFISQVTSDDPKKPPTPLRYSSMVNFWFKETTGAKEVKEWDQRREEAGKIAKYCDDFFRETLQKREDDKKYFENLRITNTRS